MNFTFLLIGINAKYIHSNPAIRSLKAYAGVDFAPYIDIAEYTINNYREDILADIFKRKPSVIGISVYIWNVGMVKELIGDLGKVLPDTEIFLGGPEVSYESESYLEMSNVKGIFIGEGEATFKKLMAAYCEKVTKDMASVSISDEVLMSIPGLLTRSGYTGMQEALSMDDLPFLYQAADSSESLLPDYENRIISR